MVRQRLRGDCVMNSVTPCPVQSALCSAATGSVGQEGYPTAVRFYIGIFILFSMGCGTL